MYYIEKNVFECLTKLDKHIDFESIFNVGIEIEPGEPTNPKCYNSIKHCMEDIQKKNDLVQAIINEREKSIDEVEFVCIMNETSL